MDDDDELPPHHVLEALTVPELPYDFTDRVMGSLQPAAAPSLLRRRNPTPWIIAVASSAVALAAMLMLWRVPIPASAPVPDAAQPSLAIAAAAPRPARAHLVLSVEPHDAVVRLDGEPLRGPSPFIATNLPPGPHAIAIDHGGFVPWTRTIDVPEGELDLPIELEPVPAVVPAFASEAADAKPSRRKATQRPTGLKDPFDLDAGSDLQDPFAPKRATLVFKGADAASRKDLTIDGRWQQIPSNGRLEVLPGHHKLTYTTPSGEFHVEQFDVRPGEVKRMRARDG
ncbi:MAG: PEGA domain-containing protein [Deltaproteobacteria bacterium]|nr:PEGA domain-containing protein [Nannocystaceae bacterium]